MKPSRSTNSGNQRDRERRQRTPAQGCNHTGRRIGIGDAENAVETLRNAARVRIFNGAAKRARPSRIGINGEIDTDTKNSLFAGNRPESIGDERVVTQTLSIFLDSPDGGRTRWILVVVPAQ